MNSGIHQAEVAPAPTADGRMAWEIWGAVAVVCLLAGLATWRIMSYATGQDPRIYLHLAEKIRASGYSPAAIRECADWIAPGYPLLLAVVQDLSGPFAAHWINLPVFMLGLWPLVALLRRIAAPQEAALALLYSFWIILTGHPLNPHFLFLPFRGMIEWLFMSGAIAVALPAFGASAGPESRCWRAFVSGMLLILGAAFRETVLLAGAPLILAWLWQALRRDRDAWKGLAATVAPLAAALAIFSAWRLQHGLWLPWQARVWFSGLLHGGCARLLPAIFLESLALIRTELGVSGMLFLAVGAVLAVRRREAAGFILLATAAVLILFYALFQMHPRFVLSALLWLALLAGWGLGATVTAAGRWLKPAWRRVAGIVLAMGLIAMNGHAIWHMEPWGPQVSRADIQALQRHPAVAAPFVFIDPDNRHLIDAILACTEAEPKDPVQEGLNITNYPGICYIRPVEGGRWAGLQRGVNGEDWLNHFFDLVPLDQGIPLGETRADVYRIMPWSKDRTAFEVPVAAGMEGGVLWLDFRAGGAADRVHVTMRDGTGMASNVELQRPAGLVPVWVPAGLLRQSNLFVEVDSAAPVPANLEPVLVSAGVLRWFGLEQGRKPSAIGMLGEGFEERSIREKHGGAFRAEAAIRIPPLAGWSSQAEAAVSVRLLPRPVSSADLQGFLGRADEPSRRVPWRIGAGRGETRVAWTGEMERAENPLILSLVLSDLPADCWYLRMEKLGIGYLPQE